MSTISQPAIFRYTSVKYRLSASGIVGLTAGLASWELEPALHLLVAYDLAVLTYVVMLGLRVSQADAEQTRILAEEKETSNAFVLFLAALFSFFSLVGVGLMLDRSQDWTPLMTRIHFGLSLLAIALSWFLLHALFAVHYARLYYDKPKGGEPSEFSKGLEFPDDVLPDFLDFMYFSYTIAVCYQTSDVTIRGRQMRRVTLAHALLSFVNVTVILGLVVEIVTTSL